MYVELSDINKHFGDYKASDHVSFSIEKGKLVGLLGPSGSGKTTILRMIAGLEHPDSGTIKIDGQVVNDIPASERGIGFVFQNYALFQYMTVEENVGFGLSIKKVPKEQIQARVNELLDLVGLTGLNRRYPSQLSGGQRQRVAFARALAPNPHLLLLDEPFAAIDAKVRVELRTWLKEMITKLGITSIFVTHDQDEAIEVADEIIITNKGRIEQMGSPIEIYQNPKTAFAATFIGQPTILNDYRRYKTFREIDGIQEAVIRPEFVRLRKKNEVLEYSSSADEGVVTSVLFRGTHIEVRVRVGEDSITARRNLEEPAVHVGEKVNIFLYRLFAVGESDIYLLENESMNGDSVVI